MTATPKEAVHDVIGIGAGFAGMYLIRRLRDGLGLDVQVFERGGDVGGTWYWNRYPGARCDVESVFYSYGFDDELQQEWTWTERYAAQPEILEYANFVADKFDLRRSIRFDTTVTSAVFDDEAEVWRVTLENGDTAVARHLVAAVGCLSVPTTPAFSGMNEYRGRILHTGDWPHEQVDFAGKRVAVIGTGSSGIQSIPEIAKTAASLTVFQRTATYSVPARNRTLEHSEIDDTKNMYPIIRAYARTRTPGGSLNEPPLGLGTQVDPVVTRMDLERRWWRGGLAVQGIFTDIMTSAESNEVVSAFVRDKIREIVHDSDTARLLEPHGHPITAKRLVLDTRYYETYNLPHVRLVSIKDTPIERFTDRGIIVGETEYEFDVIVLATGYDAMTGALNRIDIRGVSGVRLSDAWAEGPKTYLGVAVNGFPNLFIVTGPGSPSVLTNMIASIEQHVEWISDYIAYLRAADITRTEATSEAQETWVAHVNELADSTLFPRAASWYMGANIPGKPRVFMPYVGGLHRFREKCDAVAAAGYEGFVHNERHYDQAAPQRRPLGVAVGAR